jgi:S1-C subfamily serine protease
MRATVRVQRPDSGIGTGEFLFASESEVDHMNHLFILTCAHVMKGNMVATVEQNIYERSRDATIQIHYHSDLVGLNEGQDLALLEIRSPLAFPVPVVALASEEEVQAASLLEPVVAIGCGGGNPAIPTFGQIVDFDFNGFYRINAPITFGNSGGGIYLTSGHLIGICARFTDRNATPHMPAIIPSTVIRTWLLSGPYSFVAGDTKTNLDQLLKDRKKAYK